jgi:hypothetical protein
MTCCAIMPPVPNITAEVTSRKWSLKGGDCCERDLLRVDGNRNGRPTWKSEIKIPSRRCHRRQCLPTSFSCFSNSQGLSWGHGSVVARFLAFRPNDVRQSWGLRKSSKAIRPKNMYSAHQAARLHSPRPVYLVISKVFEGGRPRERRTDFLC